MTEELKPNSPGHEEAVSDTCKAMVGGLLTLASVALDKSVNLVNSEDPLSAERYIHLADKLSDMAARMHKLGEEARGAAYMLRIQGEYK